MDAVLRWQRSRLDLELLQGVRKWQRETQIRVRIVVHRAVLHLSHTGRLAARYRELNFGRIVAWRKSIEIAAVGRRLRKV
jgi:hypothetical protein